MIWCVAGLVWVLQIFFWGLGPTLLILPGRWRRFWPAFCGPAGLGLQSLVVWMGTHTALPGTDSYATASLALPAGLLLAAWWRLRRRARFGRLLAGAWRWGGVFALMAVSVAVQSRPFTKPPGLLTSAALGSCDAADYAAGARVFKEFASGDRSGFLGSSDIAQSLSVDNFFDFWLRINHFSPSALIALNATLFGRQPYELTSLLGVVLVALGLPGVFWLARSAFRFRAAGSLGVTAIYGLSPILSYAVYQTALGQLLAAPAVALLTWVGWQAYRGAGTWRRLAGWSGLLLVGDWLLFGGYNFFILFAYIPLLGFVGIRTLQGRNWARAFRWAGLIGANLLVCALFVPERVISVVERFKLFNQTPFGWAIPGFWPTGWYGAFADALLAPAGSGWLGGLAAVALGAAAGVGVWQAGRGRGQVSLLAVCCTLPIFFGYWYLLRQDRLRHDNSSYDAFKLFTVFYPGILISLCLWLRGSGTGPPRATMARVAAVGGWAALLAVNLAGVRKLDAALRRTPFFVNADLAAIAGVERMPTVEAVNVNMIQVWDRLWANCFLLHKPQYFAVATYEGRAITPLRARWDLSLRLASERLDGAADPLASNATYALIDRGSPFFVEVGLDQGWYLIERNRNQTWCWGKESPRVRVDNPHKDVIRASLSFSVRGVKERPLRVCVGERVLWEGSVGSTARVVDGVPLELPPGVTYLRFDSPGALDHASGDPRLLTFLLERLSLDVRTAGTPPAAPATAEMTAAPAH